MCNVDPEWEIHCHKDSLNIRDAAIDRLAGESNRFQLDRP